MSLLNEYDGIKVFSFKRLSENGAHSRIKNFMFNNDRAELFKIEYPYSSDIIMYNSPLWYQFNKNNILIHRPAYANDYLVKNLKDLRDRERCAKRLCINTAIIVDRINHDIRSYILKMFNGL